MACGKREQSGNHEERRTPAAGARRLCPEAPAAPTNPPCVRVLSFICRVVPGLCLLASPYHFYTHLGNYPVYCIWYSNTIQSYSLWKTHSGTQTTTVVSQTQNLQLGVSGKVTLFSKFYTMKWQPIFSQSLSLQDTFLTSPLSQAVTTYSEVSFCTTQR